MTQPMPEGARIAPAWATPWAAAPSSSCRRRRPPGGAGWTETVLHAFRGADGAGPLDLIADSAGNLYTTTESGGRGPCFNGTGCGSFVELSPPAAGKSRWTETVLYKPGNAGAAPGIAIADRKGNLYGTLGRGGAFNHGAIVELSPPPKPKSPWTQTIIFSFKGGADGSAPVALIWGRAGSLYVSTTAGGATGKGAIVRLSPPAANGSTWRETVLYSFTRAAEGDFAVGLSTDRAGKLYAVGSYTGLLRCSYAGGATPCGTIFMLSPPAGGGLPWQENVIYRFKGGFDGAFPSAPLIEDAKGRLYTTTIAGGGGGCFGLHRPTSGCGTIVRLSPPAAGRSAWTETVLYRFKDGKDGGNPNQLIADKGNLYTTTAGGDTSLGTFARLAGSGFEEK